MTEPKKPTAAATRRMTRRELIRAGAALSGAGLAGALWPQAGRAAAPTPGKLTDIEHVIIFIQENRSFDHYFGGFPGVRGWNDARSRPGAHGGKPAIYQPDPQNTADAPVGTRLPFHLDTLHSNAASTHDITHDWAPQHQSWNHGAMDGFVSARENPANENDAYGFLTMGYYNRGDIPFYYSVADAFTICDRYFCSVIGPTDPNRLYTMSATLDPAGHGGGPLITTLVNDRQLHYGKFTWTTMPEQLQEHGVSWKVYAGADANTENNVLLYFKNFQDPASPLFQNAFLPTFPGTFQADVAAGTLPQVSWVLAPLADSEHPPAPSALGEQDLNTILSTLWANPAVWAKTALFVTYDENGGFFDHIVPPTPATGTPGEFLSAPPIDNTPLGGYAGPIGLGFRVPMLVLSPFSRGGFVASDTYDHTSTLRFLETRFGVEVPNLSAWRRAATGDLTGAFNFAAPDFSTPPLPPTAPLVALAAKEFAASEGGNIPPPVPNPQVLPTQEPGTPRRPSRIVR